MMQAWTFLPLGIVAVLTTFEPMLVGAASPQSAGTPNRDRFIGVWRLISCELKTKSGSVTYPYGENPIGRITYDKAGRMSAQLMRPGRRGSSHKTSAGFRASDPDELREAVNGFIAYYGTYDIDESSRTVIHHVQACLIPSWVGTDLKRTYEFSGNRLILTAVSDDSTVRLVWEREPD